MHRSCPRIIPVAVAVIAVLTAGCSSDGDTGAADSAIPSGEASVSGQLIVSAAASLTDALTEIRDDFVAIHPEADVTINFGSSGALATQIDQGAPADVAAFADTTPMVALDDAGLLAAGPKVFARNRLVIVTKPGNPDGITGLADLADVGTISLCVDSAPCGEFANRILVDADITIPEANITRGTDVRSTLAAVTEGDAVAGIVYATDATAASARVDTVEIPEAENVVASYPIAVLRNSNSPELAEAFQAYVLSDAVRAVLRDAGFVAP